MNRFLARFVASRLFSRLAQLALICVLVTSNATLSIESTCSVEYRHIRAINEFYIVPSDSCLLEWMLMTSPAEREYTFPSRRDAMNFYLQVLHRAYGYDIVPLPEPRS